MFFVLSKTIAFFFLPSNLLIFLGVVGVVLLLTRWRRLGVCLMVASLLLMLAAGFLPIGDLLIHSLENRFPRWDSARGAPDGIVVLGGAISPALSLAHNDPVVSEDAGRIIALAKLAHEYPSARIVFSGGEGALVPKGQPEAHFLAPLLKAMNVPLERVILEDRSRNTAENAVFSKATVKPKLGERWLLVTSAWHMPRAVGCFRQVGFPVEAYPVAWRTGRRLHFHLADELSAGLQRLDLGVHEWMGLIAYRLTGRTSALFPSP